MAVLCGVDIIEIDRLRESFESLGDAFRDRIFTPNEISYCEGRKMARFHSYAARFAAKEAVSKAFGTGIGEAVMWKDIEIISGELGKPQVILLNNAKNIYEKLNAESISLSLSHCENYAVAYVVIEIR